MSGYPKTTCISPGCTRYTTRMPPGDEDDPNEWICARHWALIPKSWKRRRSLILRKHTQAVKRGDDEKAERAAWAYHFLWRRMRELIVNPSSAVDGELPEGLAIHLREIGLL